MLEQYNPDVEFDWTRILKGPAEPQPEPEVERRREGSRRDPASRRPEAEAPVERAQQLEASTPAGAATDMERAAAYIEAESAPEPASTLTPSAALTRLGPEALLRLRARYAEVMARITERIADPVQQDELKTKAERLNPDTWVTDEEVRVGLDLYEPTFETLRSVIGRPRKRRRRGRGHSRTEDHAQPAVAPGDPAVAPKSFDDTASQGESLEEVDTPFGDDGDVS